MIIHVIYVIIILSSGSAALENVRKDQELWELIIKQEIQFTKLPGTLDCGMNIIYVVEKSK